MKLIIGTCGLLLGGGLLAGCSTTTIARSVDLSQEQAGSGAYVQYVLPQTILVATITEAGAGGDKAEAATPPTVVNNLYAANAKPDAAPAKDDAKPPTLAVGCRHLADDYNRLFAANKDFIATEDALLTALDVLTRPPKVTRDVAKKADAYVNEINAGRTSAAKRDAAAAALAASYANACSKPLKIDITAEVAPDTSRVYALTIKDDSRSSDTLVFKPDENGLLTSVTTTADEKSGEIAVAAVKSLVSLVYLIDPTALVPISPLDKPAATPAAPAGDAGGSRMGGTGAGQKPKPRPQLVATAKYRAFIEEARLLKPVHPYPVLKRSYPKAPGGPLRFRLRDFDVMGNTLTLLDTFTVKLDCAPLAGTAEPAASNDGVMVSSMRSCSVTAALTAGDGPNSDVPPSRTTYFTAWDSRRPLALPLQRTGLITRTTTYAFSQGRQNSVEYNKPSNDLAGAVLPGTIVVGGVEALSTAIQGRQSMVKADADRLTAQASIYTAQTALLEARAKAMQAQADLDKKTGKSNEAEKP